MLDKAERELRGLVEGIDIEKEMMQGQWKVPDDDDREKDGDGWVDEVAALSIVKVSHLFNLLCLIGLT